MKRTAINQNLHTGEIGRVRLVEDFLPAPADLVLREENVKVTLALSRRSLDFFKREAESAACPISACPRAGRYLRGAASGRKMMEWSLEGCHDRVE